MKKTDRSLKGMLSFGAAALLAMGAATAQVASDKAFPGAEMIDSSGSYQSEINACMSGNTQQDRATCLREARNAEAEKRRGRLEDYAANAAARCEYHTVADDRAACRARVSGAGGVEGSVAGGGLLRESETVIGSGQLSSGSPSTNAMGAPSSGHSMGSSSSPSTMGGPSSPSGGSKY
jgi:hypothetical protein